MKKTSSIVMILQTRNPFKIVLLLLLVVGFHSASARKVYSTSPGGNWTSASSWSGGTIPAANDTVYILGGQTISVTTNEGSNSTYMFLIIVGTLDLSNNGKLSFSSTSKVIIENSGRILGNSNGDQISIGTGGSEYSGGTQGNITGPTYIGDGQSPTSGGGTNGCGCYNSVSSCALTSSDGYTVYVSVTAKSLVKPGTCPSGYNYNVKLDYLISFSGSNIPAGGLYTLQGNINCGGQSIFFDLPNNAGAGTTTTTSNPWRGVSDCATATIASLGCTSAVLDIQGSGLAATTCSSSTLPIKLISFKGKAAEDGIDLNWATSMEKNFDYFILERAGADLNFQMIAKLGGKGGLDIMATYNYSDRSPLSNKNYYRLKAVDLDGTFEYSFVIVVEWNGSRGGVNIYPNPILDHSFTIELNDMVSNPASLTLCDVRGFELFQTALNSSTTIINVPENIHAGVYLAKVSSTSGQRTIRVVIK